jgi:hypothetical protein
MKKKELQERKAELQSQLDEITKELARIELLEKPYEAVASGYSGRFSTFFKSEEQALKKFNEYDGKTKFRNGLLYGVQLIRHNEDGTQTLLKCVAKVEHRWKCPSEVSHG